MASSYSPKARRDRQAALYAQEMGAEALHRQLVTDKPKPVFREPDACNCGWKGQRARSFGGHHSVTCPRFEA